MILRKHVGLLAWIVFAGLAFSQPAFSADDDEPEEKAWKEDDVALPPFPEKDDLIPFRVGAITNIQYFIDGKTISVGGDGVIRYTLVVIGSGGAQNVTFEGIRCVSAERRTYAYGRADKTWSKSRNDQWMRIEGGANRVHDNLYSDHFCIVGERAVLSSDDARRSLLYNRSTILR